MKKAIIGILLVNILVLPLLVSAQSKKTDKKAKPDKKTEVQGPSSDLQNWPAGKSPKEIGDRVAARFLASPHPNFGRPTPPRTITYPEVCTWYGALKFAKESNNKELLSQLVKRFEPLL